MKRKMSMSSYLYEYSALAGMTGMSSELPSSGVSKKHKLKAGSKGLEGQGVQPVEPAEYGDDGEDKYDDVSHIAYDSRRPKAAMAEHWEGFLEMKGLSLGDFEALLHEAIDSKDADELEALVKVEDLLRSYLESMDPADLEIPARERSQAAIRAEGIVLAMDVARDMLGESQRDADEGMTFECDGDEAGEPKMPWDRSMKKALKIKKK